MGKSLKDKTVLIFDTGSFTPLAQKLAKEFGRVLYTMPHEGNGFPESRFGEVGAGIEGVERIKSIWDYVDNDEVDLYVFTDCYYIAEQEYLRRIGKYVWGSARTAWMERNKHAFYEWVNNEEMPIAETNFEVGIDNLAKNIKPDEFIKISDYRGDLETLKYYDKERSDFRLKEMELALSPFEKKYETIRQKKIEGIEIGGDYYTVNGKLPKRVMWGVENKNDYYYGKISPYDSLPEQIKYVDEKLQKVFEKEETKTHFSHEMRIDKNGEPFFLDMTARLPNPPYQLHLALVNNLGEIMYHGARGKMIEPEYAAKYGVIVHFRSSMTEEFNLPIKVGDKVKDFVHVMNLAIVDGEYVAVHINDINECGSVCGIGDTIWEARDNCEKNADEVKADSLEIDVPSKEDIEKSMELLKQYGVEFK